MRSFHGSALRGALVAASACVGLLGTSHTTPGTLPHDAVIDGIHLPAATIVTGRDHQGHLSFTLQRPYRINGWMLPAGTAVIRTNPSIVQYVLGSPAMLAGVPFESVATFQYGKLEGKFALSRNAVIGGIPCAAEAEVYFHSGAVQECNLSRPAVERGVPCAAGDYSYADGNLECVLAKPYKRLGYTWPPGAKVVFSDTGRDDVTMADKPSDMLLFGHPLPPNTDVTFDGTSLRISMRPGMLYHGCHVLDIDYTGNGAGNPTTEEDSTNCVLLSIPRNAVSAPRSH